MSSSVRIVIKNHEKKNKNHIPKLYDNVTDITTLKKTGYFYIPRNHPIHKYPFNELPHTIKNNDAIIQCIKYNKHSYYYRLSIMTQENSIRTYERTTSIDWNY